jgi:hypothetical protein
MASSFVVGGYSLSRCGLDGADERSLLENESGEHADGRDGVEHGQARGSSQLASLPELGRPSGSLPSVGARTTVSSLTVVFVP